MAYSIVCSQEAVCHLLIPTEKKTCQDRVPRNPTSYYQPVCISVHNYLYNVVVIVVTRILITNYDKLKHNWLARQFRCPQRNARGLLF
ncbi:hypothetical protein HanRHA438_Chr16g0787781 [Helianthus annuus]|uniref:Uncharacterized protein n=1 Tax=Helianthus annuus TaxID=4232 RepID=A0A9K3DW23_HELAN|nr:hypothetical protein HanXRQr2_Chr16g0777031 [Helianthus annuus]KAJ0823582.1 hypothetical protein HanPSC8_Chr16g0745411 [Helianthus annuus]KAJ0838322.1 hypothetical protein HanRHA438_Chr16g0787781 [Helianthus annuus]